MKTPTDNPNGFDRADAAARRNHTFDTCDGAMPLSVPPPRPSCPGVVSGTCPSGGMEDEPLVLWADSSFPRNSAPCPPLPWRNALLTGDPAGLLAEKCLYSVLAMTAASSLLAALWQLHGLETGWAAFAQLVGRMIS